MGRYDKDQAPERKQDCNHPKCKQDAKFWVGRSRLYGHCREHRCCINCGRRLRVCDCAGGALDPARPLDDRLEGTEDRDELVKPAPADHLYKT